MTPTPTPTPPKAIRAIQERSLFAAVTIGDAQAIAATMAAELASIADARRFDVAVALQRFAAVVVPQINALPDLSGLERRAVVLWTSRALVQTAYATLPRGPVLVVLEAYLGGAIRRALAACLGDCVSYWLDAFVEIEVAKLRKATQ